MMGTEGDCNLLVAVNASLSLVWGTQNCFIEKKAMAVLDFLMEMCSHFSDSFCSGWVLCLGFCAISAASWFPELRSEL